MSFRHEPVLSPDDGGAGSGGPAAAPAPGGAPAAGGAPAGAAAGGTGAEPSLLGQGAAGGAAAASGADPLAWLLEQHRVMTPEGKLDEAASARKQAESYAALAKRMRDVGAPPKAAEEYAFEVPEALAGKYDPAKDPMLSGFRGKALELGLSPKQFQGVMEAYAERVPAMAEALFEQRYEAGERDLRQHWKTDEQMSANLRHAATAVREFDGQALTEAGEIAEGSPVRALMNNPWFLRFAAHFGAQMQEDTSPSSGLPAASPYRTMSREQLESQEAYMNPRHADHAVVSRMVQAMYHKETGEALPA